MIGLKPYGEYRETGLGWMRHAPAHWTLMPNRGLLRRRKVLVGDKHHQFKLLSLTRKGVIVRDISTGKGKFSSDPGTSQEVRSGDLVFCLFDVPETPRTVGLSQVDGMITGAYTVFECRNPLVAQFLNLFYCSMDDNKSLASLYSGLRNTIPVDRFLGTKTPLPPPDEQAAIVKFLTWAHRRLDRVVANKRRTIALLNEQKQAIIHRAVTRGLDPDVRLKPSGIPWLGEMPEGWDTPLVGRVFRENVRSHEGKPESQLSLSQRDGLIETRALKERSLQTSSFDNWKLVHHGDLVVNRFKAHLGVFFASSLRGIVSFHYGVYAPKVDINTKYFEHLFHSAPFRTIFAGRSNGMTVGLQNLSNQNFYGVRCVLPTRDEQDQIVDGISEMTADLTATISRLEREIELLVEYRTRLTADVVTGQLDVRQAAAGLPEEELAQVEESPDEIDEEISEEDV